jgi:hypothetical protein
LTDRNGNFNCSTIIQSKLHVEPRTLASLRSTHFAFHITAHHLLSVYSTADRPILVSRIFQVSQNYFEHEGIRPNPSNAEFKTMCYLAALLGAHHIFHVSRIRVKLRSDDRTLLTICRTNVITSYSLYRDLVHLLVMAVKATGHSETSLNLHRSTQRHIPEELNLLQHRSENLKSGTVCRQ